MKKIDLARSVIRSHSHLFMCPLCGATMNMNGSNSLICSNRHCFDLSRSGSIHLLSNPVKRTKYDKQMFESRLAVNKSGFFANMAETIHHLVSCASTNTNAKCIRVLDAGCGEGSHLADLVKNLGSTGSGVLGVGMDLSKDGVRIAAREYPGLIWCVADLARSPFKDQQFDVILNIFSPSNYSEFARILHDDGILMKIVPGRDYLKELRRVFHGQAHKQTYSNEQVLTHFSKHFQPVKNRQIKYVNRIDPSELKDLIHMTPLSWGTKEENIQKALQSDIFSVTVDVTVVVGKKSRSI
ncbi:putative RNA methyltransferase [Lihuaxuella thermophila]|nr:methyltransferase domain-containing protein [Lihuaxuella thermophila]